MPQLTFDVGDWIVIDSAVGFKGHDEDGNLKPGVDH